MKEPPSPRPRSPLRFSLRTLLLVVTTCAIICGLFYWLPPAIATGVIFAALSIAAHVLANAMGTRLRDESPSRIRAERVERTAEAEEAKAPTTLLGEKTSLGWMILAPVAAGATLGIVLGWWWMQSIYGDLAWFALALASLAFGTLGSFALFCLATLAHVLWMAVGQALRHR